MKRLVFILLALPVVLVLLFLATQMLWKWSRPVVRTGAVSEMVASDVVATVSPTAALASPGQATPLLGETVLREYASSNLPPENDLTLMARLMENSLLLLKSAGNRPLSANADWADLLRGRNAAREEFLPARHHALNASGQLVDRWGTPLFFHALGGGRYEIRSAGADKRLWTDDDLHRNADGTFRSGVELNPPSLLDEARRSVSR